MKVSQPSCFVGGEVAASGKRKKKEATQSFNQVHFIIGGRSVGAHVGVRSWRCAVERVRKIRKCRAEGQALHLQHTAELQWICLSKQPFCARVKRFLSFLALSFFFPSSPPSSAGATAISRQNTDSRGACSRQKFAHLDLHAAGILRLPPALSDFVI